MTDELLKLARPGSRRSFVLMGVGAVFGLVLAGWALFSARGTTAARLPDEDVALVNQRHILRSDFVAQVEATSGGAFARAQASVRRRVLDDMIREELYVQRGLELDLAASDPDVRTALVSGVERQIEASVTAQSPSEAQLRARYARDAARYASQGLMDVHDLTAKSDAGGLEAAAARLRAGAGLATVIAAHGLVDRRAGVGLDFDYAAKIHMGPQLFALAAGMRTGGIAGPVVIDGEPHLLVMSDRRPPQPQPFDEARPRVLKDFLEAESRRIEAADAKYLRGKAEIVLAPEYR